MNEMFGALESVPGSRLAVAALLTIASYLALSGYELLAISYIGKRLSYKRVTFVTWPPVSRPRTVASSSG